MTKRSRRLRITVASSEITREIIFNPRTDRNWNFTNRTGSVALRSHRSADRSSSRSVYLAHRRVTSRVFVERLPESWKINRRNDDRSRSGPRLVSIVYFPIRIDRCRLFTEVDRHARFEFVSTVVELALTSSTANGRSRALNAHGRSTATCTRRAGSSPAQRVRSSYVVTSRWLLTRTVPSERSREIQCKPLNNATAVDYTVKQQLLKQSFHDT